MCIYTYKYMYMYFKNACVFKVLKRAIKGENILVVNRSGKKDWSIYCRSWSAPAIPQWLSNTDFTMHENKLDNLFMLFVWRICVMLQFPLGFLCMFLRVPLLPLSSTSWSVFSLLQDFLLFTLHCIVSMLYRFLFTSGLFLCNRKIILINDWNIQI